MRTGEGCIGACRLGYENTKENNKQFSNGADKHRETTLGTSSNQEDTKETKDTNATVKGFINVTQSELLIKFRSTFLNIDDDIIKELAVDFMGVF